MKLFKVLLDRSSFCLFCKSIVDKILLGFNYPYINDYKWLYV